jgi:hypothetical protein
MEHLPLVEARRHYPLAQLLADFREMFFPRYLDPSPTDEPKEPPRRRKAWSAEECLPYYAWFQPPVEINMSQQAAQTLVALYDRLPRWARALAPIEAATAVLQAPGE